MGLLQWLTGNRGPDPGISPVSKADLLKALRGLNNSDLAWRIVDSERGRADLAVQWKADELRWAKHLRLLPDVNDMLMRLDEASATVRAVDVHTTLNLSLLSMSASVFRGQENEVGSAYVFGRKANGKRGFIETDRISTSEFKKPVRDLVAAHGWVWKGVAFARL
jgi:hypothetical protein